MRFYFARTARRHKIGKAHVLSALANNLPTRIGDNEYKWIAIDDRGIELEIIGFQAMEDRNLIIIKHVMPTDLPKN